MKRTASENNDQPKKQRISTPPAAADTIPSTATGSPGVVLTLGINVNGQLGFNPNYVIQKNKPAILGLKHDVENICAGGLFSVCITSDGKLISFGCNDAGELGFEAGEHFKMANPPAVVKLDGKVVQVSAGGSHCAVLLENGEVYAWGSFIVVFRGIGLNGKGTKTELPMKMLPGEKVVKISSGVDHLAMLTVDGRLFTCGCGEQGQLGRVFTTAGDQDSQKGLDYCFTPGEVPVQNKITDIWTTSYATFAKIGDEIYASGLNNFSQLGMGDTENRFQMVKAKAFSNKAWVQICGDVFHLIARDDQGIVHALGRSDNGRLGLGTAVSENAKELTVIPALADKKCIDIACGDAVSLAVTAEGEVYGWGWGATGQLGNGNDGRDIHEPRLVGGNLLNTKKAVRVCAGSQHTMILARK